MSRRWGEVEPKLRRAPMTAVAAVAVLVGCATIQGLDEYELVDVAVAAPADAGRDGSPGIEAGPTCVAPRQICGGVCTDTVTDPAHCGGCGKACSFPTETAGCVGGVCVPTGCGPMRVDCN